MDALDRHAELVKLGRVLGCELAELHFLEAASPESLRAFRHAATLTLFDDGRETFQRLAKLSKLLPTSWLVRFTGSLVGPVLAGRIASEMEPERAGRLASELPLDFLAEVCLHLEPSRSRAVIQGIPPERVTEVTLELLRREEYVTMACFVDILERPVLARVIQAIRDEAALLRIGFFVEGKSQLDMLVELFSDERLERLVSAAHTAELWPEAIALMSHVAPRTGRRLGDIAARQPEERLLALVHAAQIRNLVAPLLTVVLHMSPASQARVAALSALEQPALLAALIDACVSSERWSEVQPLLSYLPAGPRSQALELAHARGLRES